MKALHLIVLSIVGFGVLADDYPPVKVELYFETLCPYSIDYFVTQLYPTWTELKDIMDVHLYAFGNAKYYPDGDGWSFKCQHGPDECKGNMIQACAHKHFDDINVEMDFMNCLLSSSYPPDAGEKCAEEVNQPWGPIDTCVNSVEGQDLLHDVGVQQEQLDPALYFVPWIIVNDVFSENQVTACQMAMKRVVCHDYTGPKPEECSKPFEYVPRSVGHSRA